ncbi:MAG: acetate--CoA ligase family protein [Hyphomicrobiales bacterium]|nr:acetate--CoA ligase family protein [Hyphomicrobiales bacterium]
MQPSIDTQSLSALFAPKSIAVVGASAEATKIGGRPIDFLKRFGYAGEIIPVNPRSSEVQGLKAYPSLTEIPGGVDLAILSVPASAVVGAVEDAAKKGVKSLVVFSSGFAEVDEAGRAEQDRMTQIARKAGMRILGPNCLGFANVALKANATFSPVIGVGQATPGRVAIVSQSGAFGAYAYSLARGRGLGLSHWIATGNEADVDVADCIGWLAGSDDTDVILAYLEGAKDGRKLMRALEMARAAGKPVIVAKVGRTSLGAAAAASHTSALAGEDAVYDAALRQCGAYRAKTIEEFFDIGLAISSLGLPKSNRIAIVTVSGGVGVLMADDALEAGLDVAETPADAQAKIKELVSFAAPRNPVDTTGQVASDRTLLDKVLNIVLATGRYDMLATFHAAAGLSPEFGMHTAELVGRIRKEHPHLAYACCALFRPEVAKAIEETGCMPFEDPSRMMRTLGALAGVARAMRTKPLPVETPKSAPAPKGVLNEADALRALGAAGVPVVPSAICRSADEAAAAAQKFGFPVVAKIASADILHKSDIGGVKLRLADAAAVRAAFDEVTANAKKAAPQAKVDGVLIAPMISGVVECIVGVQNDPAFGPVVMFGLGGVMVEVLKDVSFRAAPFGRDVALDMIREIKGYKVLEGVRGAPPADLDALADALVAVSRFAAAADDSLETLDINPFVVRPKGQGALALDAVLVGR